MQKALLAGVPPSGAAPCRHRQPGHPQGRRPVRRRGGPGRRPRRRRARWPPTASRSPSTTSARTSPTRAEAEHTRDAYLALLDGLAPLGARRRRRGVGEALGLRPGAARRRTSCRPGAGPARSSRRRPRSAPRSPSTWRTTAPIDSTLGVLAELRKEHPGTGAVLQAMLFRTEDDAKALAVTGSRVRLVKGAYNEPADRRAPKQDGRRRRLRPRAWRS